MKLEERFVGCMLGLAIGDALGYPVEFMNRAEIKSKFGPEGVTDFVEDRWHKRGNYSDDTQMSIAVAKALLAADPKNLDDIMRCIRKEFVDWSNSPENKRAPGQTCMDGCRQMESGVHWFSSGDPYSKGCGAAMRAAPIGMYYFNDLPRLVEVSRAVAICTHAHPTGLSSSIAAAAAVAFLLRGEPIEQLLIHLKGILIQDRGVPGVYAERVSLDPLEEQTQSLDKVAEALLLTPEAAFDIVGGGWTGEEAVAGALYCFLRSPDDFRTTVLTAANASLTDMEAPGKGRCDSDSIGCIAGAISGAYNGIDGIPQEWIDTIENRQLLWDIGMELAAKFSASQTSSSMEAHHP